MTTNELLGGTRKGNLIQDALGEHPSFLVRRAVFENIQLTIDDVDYYLAAKELLGDEVDRIWLLKQLSDGYVLDAPYHLIKRILKQ